MRGKRVALGVAASLADRVVMSLIQLALVPIMATHWGLERYGSWSMLMTVPSLLALGDLGFGGAAVVRVTMEVARGEIAAAQVTIRSATQVVVGACMVLLTIVGLSLLVLPQTWLPAFGGVGKYQLHLALMALALYTCVSLCSSLLAAVFRSDGRYAQNVVLSTATSVLENALLVATVLSHGGLLDSAIAMLTGRCIGFFVTFVFALRLNSGVMPGLRGGSASVRRELFGPAMAMMAIPFSTALLLQGTVTALGFSLGAAAVPAFVAARTLSRLGLQATQMLTGALMPEFGGAAARGEYKEMRRMVVLLTGTAALIALPFAAALAVLGPEIVHLWSNGRIEVSHPMMVAMAVSALCGALWKPLSDLMLASNRQRAFAASYGLVAVAGVLFTLLAAPVFGEIAPSLALALSDVAMLVVVARFARTHWLPKGTLRAAVADFAGYAKRLVPQLRRFFRLG